MNEQGFLLNLIIFVSAAVMIVPLCVRFGLGSVLGYLLAGIVIGPWGLGVIGNVENILHFSELGVVFLLFLIGLELEPRKLWGMRKPILGTGSVQMGVTSLSLMGLLVLLDFPWQTALLIGLSLALSSTATSLQLLNEKQLLSTSMGRTGFAILLFQDISVIPIIALIPLLAIGVRIEAAEQIIPHTSGLLIVAVFIVIFLLGRFILQHIFRFVASTNLPEIFTALSLLLVCGLAYTMHQIGISMALGAFLGGVILADSQYRHALQSDIQPFKGLLLGLFFISVGMNINFALLLSQPLLIIALTVALVFGKAAVLYVIAIVAKIKHPQRALFAFLFSQSGEFAFILFAFAVNVGAITDTLSNTLILIVAMSMVMTPILMIIYDTCLSDKTATANPDPMQEIEQDNEVILVGFGRFGQVIGQLLALHNIHPTVIDNDPDHIARIQNFGYKTYYGDVLRQDVLHSIGAQRAKIIVLTGEGCESTNLAIDMIKREFPNLTIVARAHDRAHAKHLMNNGVTEVTRETFFSAVDMGKKTLRQMGIADAQVDAIAADYIQNDTETLLQQSQNRDDEKAR